MAVNWRKQGLLIEPQDPRIPWLGTHAGASFALATSDPDLFELYVTGRDPNNRSQIGRLMMRVDGGEARIESVEARPCLMAGQLGSFDQDGVAYPWLVRRRNEVFLYYVGWVKSVQPPFQNHIGVACRQPDGTFRRVSRAPILGRTDAEPFGSGSCAVLPSGDGWQMWYTSFREWESTPAGLVPRYGIRFAHSADGLNWHREGSDLFNSTGSSDARMARPSVLRDAAEFRMWYCARGDDYRIHAARSTDGKVWRSDPKALPLSDSGWDAKGMAYPHVFRHRERLALLYSGNRYGQGGLGIAFGDDV